MEMVREIYERDYRHCCGRIRYEQFSRIPKRTAKRSCGAILVVFLRAILHVSHGKNQNHCYNAAAEVLQEEEEDVNYYIADMHLFCRSQVQEGGINYDNRPFETLDQMHQYFLEHWNAKVTNGDTVYILGDVAFRGKNDTLVALVAQLKGKKILVLGNHDDLRDYRYTRLFHDIVYYEEIQDSVGGKQYKLVLCHYPILFWKDQHRGTILLYGHTHQTAEDEFFQNCIRQMNADEAMRQRRTGGKEIRAINVGAMCSYMNYEPRSLAELLTALPGEEAFNSSLTMEEIERNFKNVDLFSGVMEGLEAALAHAKATKSSEILAYMPPNHHNDT